MKCFCCSKEAKCSRNTCFAGRDREESLDFSDILEIAAGFNDNTRGKERKGEVKKKHKLCDRRELPVRTNKAEDLCEKCVS